MSAATDITVKKDDGATDIVYVLKSPSSGDGTPTRWRADSAGTADSFKPELTISGHLNGANTARWMNLKFTMPQVYTDTSTSLSAVASKATASLDFSFPVSMPDTVVNEAVSQLFNLINNSKLRTMFKEKFPAT
jgi:hypothetical protein